MGTPGQRYRVFTPRGRPQERLLALPRELFETARATLRLLAENPRPSWATALPSGRWAFYLPPRGEFRIVYEIREQDRTVEVVDVSAVTPQTPTGGG